MASLLGEIAIRLRYLAGKFTGTEMSHRLPKSDKGSARSLGVTYVDDSGNDIDVGDTLLSLADDIDMLDNPISIKEK